MQISNAIQYVGVNDHDIDLFEEKMNEKLQELDSHTSYLAIKEKCVREFINNAKQYTEIQYSHKHYPNQ